MIFSPTGYSVGDFCRRGLKSIHPKSTHSKFFREGSFSIDIYTKSVYNMVIETIYTLGVYKNSIDKKTTS